MTAVSISLATDILDILEAIDHAFMCDNREYQEVPRVVIEGRKTRRRQYSTIPKIVEEAARRAHFARAGSQSVVGVGLAFGRVELICRNGAAKAQFHFTVIISVDNEGAITYAVPDAYQDDIHGDIWEAVSNAFQALPLSLNEDRGVVTAASLSAHAWASLEFPDPEVEVELFN